MVPAIARDCNILIHACEQRHDASFAPQALRTMERQGIVPNVFTYNAFVDARHDSNQLKYEDLLGALEGCQHLRTQGFLLNVMSSRSLLGAWSRYQRTEQTWEACRAARFNRLVTFLLTYSVLLPMHWHGKDPQRALQAFQTLQRQGVVSDAISCSSFADTCDRCDRGRRPTRAGKLFRHMLGWQVGDTRLKDMPDAFLEPLPTARRLQPKPKPKPHRDMKVEGLRTMWQAPGELPRAVLFLAHGMCHGAEDFFHEPGFSGLPEEHRIVKAALELRFLVVACSSTDRRFKGWQPEVDGPKVAKVLPEVLRLEGLGDSGIPFCALGVSVGGAFVMTLPQWLKLSAIVCQVMAVPNEMLRSVGNVPPVLFVHMPRDERTARGVEDNIQELRKMGVVVDEMRCEPLAIRRYFFAEKLGCDAPTSKIMAETLRAGGIIDSEGTLQKDPRSSDWRSWLNVWGEVLSDSLVADRSPIAEVLNVAYAHHEITAGDIERQLGFCIKALQPT